MKIFAEGREISVRELTVSEIKSWFTELGANSNGPTDAISEVLFEDISLREIAMLTDLSPTQIDSFKPSALHHVVNAIFATNPHWLSCRRRIMSAAERIRANSTS